MPRFQNRRIPYSLQFNGANQYGVVTSAPFANAAKVTILCWVKLSAGSGTALWNILETAANATVANALLLFQNSAASTSTQTVLRWFVRDQSNGLSTSAETVNLPLNRWMRVVCVVDQTISSNQASIYIDGINAVAGRAANGNCTSGIATNNLNICSRNTASNFFPGNFILDRVITGKAFTAAEVASEFYTGQVPAGGSTILQYAWNEGNGATIADSSGNAKDITLTNSPVWTNDTSSSQPRISLTAAPFVLSGVQLWAKSGQLMTMVNGAVSQVGDLSGHDARALAQATAGSRPVPATGITALTSLLRFDGTDDALSALFALVQPLTVFLVFKTRSLTGTGSGATNYILDGAGVLNTIAFADYAGPNSTIIYNGTLVTASGAAGLGAYVYAMVVMNGASSKIRVNGVDLVTGDAGNAAAAGGVIFGATQNLLATHFGAIDLAEAVVTNTAPTAGEISSVEQYFRATYNL